MKKLIAKLSVGIFSLGLCVNLSAEEWKSYKFKIAFENGNKTFYSEESITLDKGDKLDFVNLITTSVSDSVFLLKVWLDEESSSELRIYNSENGQYNSNYTIRQNFKTIYGPCKVEVGAAINGHPQVNRWVLCNAKITRAHESQGRNVTGYSLVLPESKDTNYNLVLESSTDLVNWAKDETGTKTPSDKKRFYRLRAVKE